MLITRLESLTPIRCGRHSLGVVQDVSSQFVTAFCSAVLHLRQTHIKLILCAVGNKPLKFHTSWWSLKAGTS